ncbi:MAG TPA: 6-phosphogluconolactonase [Patescibacteria group bacterium]|nr:6-phosphogluconolactonase [Patescibacteria group bacterium]
MIAISFIPTEEGARREATRKLAALLKKFRNVPILLLLSGGSAISILERFALRQNARNITISVIDERYSTDPLVNNFLQISQTRFYRSAEKNGVRSMRTVPRKNESLSALALRWEKMLRAWKKRNPRGTIIATMGIGTDGHTAGIMPFAENEKIFLRRFNNSHRWVVGYDATRKKNEHPLRVTTIIPFLRMIDHAIMFAVGSQKKNVLRRVLQQESAPHYVPARIIHDMKDVYLFTDQKGIMKEEKNICVL